MGPRENHSVGKHIFQLVYLYAPSDFARFKQPDKMASREELLLLKKELQSILHERPYASVNGTPNKFKSKPTPQPKPQTPLPPAQPPPAPSSPAPPPPPPAPPPPAPPAPVTENQADSKHISPAVDPHASKGSSDSPFLKGTGKVRLPLHTLPRPALSSCVCASHADDADRVTLAFATLCAGEARLHRPCAQPLRCIRERDTKSR